ncbi:hypothetical protein B0H14DRAFT_3588682 [Mycena olivaceomarginata]|nr:hypothetical protein B0H14DRAFT_3588682 [Mycena olivaceomarginata]
MWFTNSNSGIQPHPAAERTQIIEWLPPINFFLRHADISRARQAGTGEWLLADPLFKKMGIWLREDALVPRDSCVAYLYRMGTNQLEHTAGAGKTVPISKVVDYLGTDFLNTNLGAKIAYGPEGIQTPPVRTAHQTVQL